MSGFEALRETVSAAPGYEDVLLGCATPMEKVLPRVPVFRPLPETIAIEAARNEKEAAQLIVMPLGKERKKVGVRLTAFTGPGRNAARLRALRRSGRFRRNDLRAALRLRIRRFLAGPAARLPRYS